MTAQLASQASELAGVAVIVALVIVPQVALVVWALRNPLDERK